ncbi:scavenger receptor class B member 1 isoform X2 [Cimex lectularius]|uniref:Scavenger receptor class B member 1 n=1 Tax=Cimex lectularius TaxID=79782 RepID=A0A8I6RZF3_CIMLE|nr:scavenger receptor class B member 1 isoform X2 [Cimex lectularius]
MVIKLPKICTEAMGYTKQYLRVGQSAKNRLFGVPPVRRGPSLNADKTPLQMLVSQDGQVNYSRLAVVTLGLCAVALGILMSTIPWVDYLILKQLRLWNGTLSYYYWRQPGVLRLTKVWVFNVTNPDGFLNQGEKPRLQEVGPFVYREDMEKVNVQFYDNGTVSFQHKKILKFVPERSLRKDIKLVVPNIPLLTLSSKTANLPSFMLFPLSMALRTFYGMSVFNHLTPDELLFGYEEKLVHLAHKFYPRGMRPPAKMGLLLGRNTTLISDIETIYTGHTSMKDFGLLDKLNGLDNLPYWDDAPCNSIRASEGSFFPPRDITHEDVVNIFDKDLCRVWPLRYRYDEVKDGIKVGHYTPDDNLFTSGDTYEDNKCYCPGSEDCPVDGFQDISPCQFGAPVYTSYPHFYGVKDESITNAVEGLNPNKEKHETIVKIQQKLGVPLEARVRIQLNLKVTQANLGLTRKFPSIMMPIVWVEEGAEELPDYLIRWIYLSTTLAEWLVPLCSYVTVAFGALILVGVFIRTYRSMVFTKENVELGKSKLRRGSSFFVNGQHKLLILRDSYTLLRNQPSMAETSFNPEN